MLHEVTIGGSKIESKRPVIKYRLNIKNDVTKRPGSTEEDGAKYTYTHTYIIDHYNPSVRITT